MANYKQKLRGAWDMVGDAMFGPNASGSSIRASGTFGVIARDPRITVSYAGLTVAKFLWEDWFHNQAMNADINDMLTVTYNGGTQKPQWYIAPINATPTPSISAADTSASHAGWAEATTYSEATRQEYNPTVSNKVMTNSSSVATITASGSVTVAGAFVISDNAKSGATGILAAAGAFTGGSQVLASLQTLDLIYRRSVSN